MVSPNLNNRYIYMLNFKKTLKCQKANLTRLRTDTDGNASLMFAVSLSALLLGIAVAIDLSSTFSIKSKMQDSLDAAVLTAAINAGEDDYGSFGQNAYEINLSESRLENSAVRFEKQKTGNRDEVVGTATASLPLFFSGILKKSALDITVRSVANVSTPSVSPCIIALSRTGTPGIILNSNATITAPECEMHVHSESNNAFNANSNINIDLSKTCVAGSGVTDNSNGAIGILETNCAVSADPFAGTIPEPSSNSCNFTNGNYDNPPGGVITLQPGVYCGWHNFNNSSIPVEFMPGTYVIRNGGWNVNGGNWSGVGVTFYMYDSSLLNFNSNVNANFSAPTSGDYKGIFLTERPGLSGRDYNLNSGSNFNFDGAIYLPSKRVTMNSGSALIMRQTQLVADRIIFNGSLGIASNQTPSNTASLDPYLTK